ncbi:acyl-CoA reductase [Flagellimonas aquimarina]|uniref:Acyl-CoA reductase n=1 Tax=Flagellimonas aquimarina TaxID=2201895 RepID=A0A316L218_9FLAO|nr:acyl-CoA reductase [Allomuricauda koreensis]PWL39009.1 acyl-CoA reductase [Allomuricauda koreensis]
MTAYPSTLKAFVKLGSFIGDFCENHNSPASESHQEFHNVVIRAELQNSWFNQENILFALEQWSMLLTEKHLTDWLSHYNIDASKKTNTIGLVMAGNIPLVGFHDFLCVLLSGNKVLAKLSSNDTVLLPFLSKYLIEEDPSLEDKMQFVEGKFESFDAVIATGSNNTSRYFEYYFGKKPNIIRKNRNSVAVLTGNESKEQLKALGEDIFRYYGLGCRNVSKIYVPKDYNFDEFFNGVFPFKDIIHQNKYANNYDYNKAVYLMSEFKILDNGFLILKEDKSFSSPIASLFYEYYDTLSGLKKEIQENKEHIQCIVSNGVLDGEINYGETQKPKLDDYADGVNTMDFLLLL